MMGRRSGAITLLARHPWIAADVQTALGFTNGLILPPPLVPESPQTVAALGAAMIAAENIKGAPAR